MSIDYLVVGGGSVGTVNPYGTGGSGGGKSLGAFVTSTTVLTFYTSTYLDVAADTSLDSANLQITIIK